LRSVQTAAEQRTTLATTYARFPLLSERRAQLGGSLSGGEQQLLAIGRALMGMPRLLMLDEPSLGLAPRLVHQILHVIQDLRASGLTILLVEQNARQALRIADRAYVLDSGNLVANGAAEDLLRSDTIRAAYLGLGAAFDAVGASPSPVP
jgi:branched-chain amino acid transport system ATP-binding protein